MAFRTLDGVDVAGKRVLLRADLNVPVRGGKITDLTRIERLSPTIRELAGKGTRVVIYVLSWGFILPRKIPSITKSRFLAVAELQAELRRRSHVSVYNLLGDGRLRAVEIGARTLTSCEALNEFIPSSPPAKIITCQNGRKAAIADAMA